MAGEHRPRFFKTRRFWIVVSAICIAAYLLLPLIGNTCAAYSDFDEFCAALWRSGPAITTDGIWDHGDPDLHREADLRT